MVRLCCVIIPTIQRSGLLGRRMVRSFTAPRRRRSIPPPWPSTLQWPAAGGLVGLALPSCMFIGGPQCRVWAAGSIGWILTRELFASGPWLSPSRWAFGQSIRVRLLESVEVAGVLGEDKTLPCLPGSCVWAEATTRIGCLSLSGPLPSC